MAETTLMAAPATAIDTQIGDIQIRERADLALVSAAIPLGGDAKLAKCLTAEFGLKMPSPTMATAKGETWALKSASDQLLLIVPRDGENTEHAVMTAISGTAYTTEQSDAWVVLDMDGETVRDALERVCPIDLHDDVFPVGTYARTVMEHMGALVLRVSQTSFRLFSARSSALSFTHALETSCRYVASD